jgi:hypothetical protein
MLFTPSRAISSRTCTLSVFSVIPSWSARRPRSVAPPPRAALASTRSCVEDRPERRAMSATTSLISGLGLLGKPER